MSRKIEGGLSSDKNVKNNGKAEAGAELFLEAGLLGTSSA
jgi:hypothetical protein